MAARMRYRAFLVTLSPKGDLKEIPEGIVEYFADPGWEKVLAVAEKADKWHIHIVAKHRREMRKDNVRAALVNKLPDYGKEGPWEVGRVALDVQACVTCSENGIAAGYMAKTEDYKILLHRGFSEEDYTEGAAEYERGRTTSIVTIARKTLKACAWEVYQSLYWITEGALERKWILKGKVGPKPGPKEIHEVMIDAGHCFLPHIKKYHGAPDEEIVFQGKIIQKAGIDYEALAIKYTADVYGKRILENAGLEEKPEPATRTLLPDIAMPPDTEMTMPEGYIPGLEFEV